MPMLADGMQRGAASDDARDSANFVMGFDGDRSMDIATQAEGTSRGLVHYLIRLQLDSGRDVSN